MYTPFNHRVTEYLPDGNAFLKAVTPDFFTAVLEPYRDGGGLFDRLLRLVGTPGSGKTTLAKVLQYQNAAAVAAHRKSYQALYEFLSKADFITIGQDIPKRIVARLPMESEYRTFGSLPYQNDVRDQLLFRFIQARAVLTWINEIESAGIDLSRVKITVRRSSPAAIEAAGGSNVYSLRLKASEIERSLYAIVAAIVPPTLSDVPQSVLAPYAPFYALEKFVIDDVPVDPLIILDDFHQLAKGQRLSINWQFTRRELKISRWVMMRYDALSARSVISNEVAGGDELPSDVDAAREIVTIMMQDDGLIAKFNRIAPKMADQQLEQVALLWNDAGIHTLSSAMSTVPPPPSKGFLRELENRNREFGEKHRISDKRIKALLSNIDELDIPREPDVRLHALWILMNRHVSRIQQTSLMDELDPEPTRKVAASPEILEAARIQLWNLFSRPYYYGPKILADAATGNAEQYLRLCDPLVRGLEVNWIQNRTRELDATAQHRRLLKLVQEYRDSWRFPENALVARIVDFVSRLAKDRTMQPTCPVPPGPNAIAIPLNEFSRIFKEARYDRLGEGLKFAVAYNVLALRKSNHKSKEWRVLQLNGFLCIANGLPLAHGNFVDVSSVDALLLAMNA